MERQYARNREIGGVIGMKEERMFNKVPYQVFVNKVEEYVLREYKETGQFLAIAIKKGEDPVEEHEICENAQQIDE